MSVELVELGDICDFAYGDGLREDRRRSGPVPVYGSNGIVGWHDQALTHGPTIVVGRKGSIGQVNFSPVACFPIDTTYYIETTKKPSDLQWLYYALVALDLTKLNKSAAVPGLNREDAYEKKIQFPPLPEQHRIAGILDRADRLRWMRRYAGQMSGAFLQALFVRMFGDPRTNSMGWDVEQLDEIVQPGRGVTYGIVQAGPHVPDGIPYIRTGDIVNGSISPFGLLRTSRDIAESYRRSEVKFGDIVFSIRATVGTCALLPPELDGANLTQGTARIAPGKRMDRFYLVWMLRSNGMQQWFRQQVKGSTFFEITLARLREAPIMIPPLALQQQFARVVQRFERLRAQQREAERQAEQLFQALLHRAFTGGL